MNVLVLAGRLSGGAAEVCLQVVRHLPEDVRATVAYLGGPTEMVGRFESHDIPVYRLADTPWSLDAIASLREILNSDDFDLVHTHMMVGGLLGRPLASLAGVPVVHTQHTNYANRSPPAKYLDIASAPFGDTAVCVSNSVAESLPSVYAGRTEVVHNCIDVGAVRAEGESTWEELDWTDTLDPSAPLVVNVARYDPKKRRSDLVRSFVEVVRSYPDAQLVLTGKRSDRQRQLAELASELGIRENVAFVGFVENPQTVYHQADIVALPSESEGFSISMLEAMAHGRPIVATDIPAFVEALGETYPSTVPVGDPSVLGDEIVRILSDAAYRDTLVEAVTTRVEKFSGSAAAEEYAGIYRRLVEPHVPDGGYQQ